MRNPVRSLARFDASAAFETALRWAAAVLTALIISPYLFCKGVAYLAKRNS